MKHTWLICLAQPEWVGCTQSDFPEIDILPRLKGVGFLP